jgi:hypothetical protein
LDHEHRKTQPPPGMGCLQFSFSGRRRWMEMEGQARRRQVPVW